MYLDLRKLLKNVPKFSLVYRAALFIGFLKNMAETLIALRYVCSRNQFFFSFSFSGKIHEHSLIKD